MAGLYVAIAGQRKQFAVQILLQYSERFRWLLESSPFELADLDKRVEDLPESNHRLTKQILQVFLTLVELHHLREKKYVTKEVWQLWMPEVQRVLRSPLFRREWATHRGFFGDHVSFCRFIASIQKEQGL